MKNRMDTLRSMFAALLKNFVRAHLCRLKSGGDAMEHKYDIRDQSSHAEREVMAWSLQVESGGGIWTSPVVTLRSMCCGSVEER